MHIGVVTACTILTVTAISGFVNSILVDRVFRKLEKDYPLLHRQLGNPATHYSRYNLAPQVWLLTGGYNSLNDTQITHWARLANVMFIICAVFLASFLYLLNCMAHANVGGI
jgi:hypothetical protein